VLREAFRGDLDLAAAVRITYALALELLAPLALGALILTGLTLLAQLASTGFGFASANLVPKMERLNPLRKLRDLPRQNFPLFLQAIVLLPLFAFAVYGVVRDNLDSLRLLPLQTVDQGAQQLSASLQALVWKASGVFVVVGAYDYWRQRRRFLADMRMSKQEVREEAKELEANPQVKGRIRRLQREWLRRRMMQQVPKATAVIVNPTHYAVAIRYAVESMGAPLVVAKGKNYLAMRIRKKAVEHQVPIVENPPLAQALYKSSEVGQEIPAHLYRAVAEILAYIYRLMGGRLPG
jgi:flagellar biosynthetic protein FlhB